MGYADFPDRAGKNPNEVSKMRNVKLNRIVEYLKSVEFYHDTFDLSELGVEKVMAEYGICEEFSDSEVSELSNELEKLAEQNEFREAARLANLENWEARGVYFASSSVKTEVV